MTKELSNAAVERAAAQRALKNGDLKDRETYTAKQVAMRCGTDAKTMRKFFRSSHSTVDPVGQGGRYEFDAADMPKIKSEFASWLSRSSVKKIKAAPEIAPKKIPGGHGEGFGTGLPNDVDYIDTELKVLEFLNEDSEPTDEELMELAEMELDLDDMEVD